MGQTSEGPGQAPGGPGPKPLGPDPNISWPLGYKLKTELILLGRKRSGWGLPEHAHQGPPQARLMKAWTNGMLRPLVSCATTESSKAAQSWQLLIRVPTHARLSSRIGHVCNNNNNNTLLVLRSPGNLAYCADRFPKQQPKTARLLSPGSLAWTNLVAPVGLVPAAENPQGLGL